MLPVLSVRIFISTMQSVLWIVALVTDGYMCMDLFVLRFYGPVNPMGSCRAWSVYLTTRLLGRLSPLSS